MTIMRNKRILLTALLTFAFCLLTFAFAPPARAQSIGDSLANIFKVDDTNSLIHAREINLTPRFIWDSKGEQPGGGFAADWWVTKQQGMQVAYDEFADRKSWWSVGYQARTVFKSLEVSLGTGVTQNVDDPLGDVRIYIQPQATYKLAFIKFADARLSLGAKLFNDQKPMPFFGLTFHFTR